MQSCMDMQVNANATKTYTTRSQCNGTQMQRHTKVTECKHNGTAMLRSPSYSLGDESELVPHDDGELVPAINRLVTNCLHD